SSSACPGDGVGVASCAKHANRTNISNAANRSGERTRLAYTLRRLDGKHVFGQPPNTAGQRPALPRILMRYDVNITNFLQLRESDLLGPELLRGVASPSSHSSFCEEVFSLRIRETNEVDRTNILAPGL